MQQNMMKCLTLVICLSFGAILLCSCETADSSSGYATNRVVYSKAWRRTEANSPIHKYCDQYMQEVLPVLNTTERNSRQQQRYNGFVELWPVGTVEVDYSISSVGVMVIRGFELQSI